MPTWFWAHGTRWEGCIKIVEGDGSTWSKELGVTLPHQCPDRRNHYDRTTRQSD